MADEDPDRRRFLSTATCAIGGAIGIGTIAPIVRFVIDPAGAQTVTTPRDPLDLGAIDRFSIGAPPRKVDVIAPTVKDAWTAARDVVLGSAWIRRVSHDKLEALSAVCPHLGCAVRWDEGPGTYLCPCHDSRFGVDGTKLTGPSKRGLDPLPLSIERGRIRLTWVRYKLDTSSREPT